MTDSTELEPPWARFPEIPQGSIGWRMGGGEDYIYRWFDFAREHWTSRAAALIYLRRHPPAPRRWANFVVTQLLEADERAGIEPPTGAAGQALSQFLRDSLISEGLVDDDVAYPTFVRNALEDGALPPPWRFAHGAEESLEKGLRYAARELGWWARWLGTECGDRNAYLDKISAPNGAPAHWMPVLAQIRAGTSTAWSSPSGDVAGLLAATVQHGLMPPPWLGERAPLDRETSWELGAADDRDHWLWWVAGAFDDKKSWLGYLERWPPTPPWRAFVDDKLRGMSARSLD